MRASATDSFAVALPSVFRARRTSAVGQTPFCCALLRWAGHATVLTKLDAPVEMRVVHLFACAPSSCCIMQIERAAANPAYKPQRRLQSM